MQRLNAGRKTTKASEKISITRGKKEIWAASFTDEKETKELERFMAEKQRIKEREAAEKKARRAEINRKIAKEKKKKRKENEKQVVLFDLYENA